MKVITSIFLLGFAASILQAQIPDASLIMNKSRELTLTGSVSSDVRMTITEKNGSIRTRTISMTSKSYPEEQEKRLIRFLEPADVRGTSILIIDNSKSADEMWVYLPALKKTRRIVSTEKGKSFMSSEFSNSDMTSPAISDFNNKHLEGSGEDDVWIIESVPVSEAKADEYGYSRKVSYVDREHSRVLKMEFYNSDNDRFKIIEIKDIYPLSDNRYIVKNMTAENLKSGRRSSIEMTRINAGGNIEDNTFTVQNLEK